MELIPNQNNSLSNPAVAMAAAGKAANQAAEQGLFIDYQGRKAANTLRRQAADLAAFKDYLLDCKIPSGDLQNNPEAWQGVTWGLVAGFVQWQLKKGYAVSTVNFRLSTVKVYANLAARAGSLAAGEQAMIRLVNGYQHKEVKRVDDSRAELGVETRKGAKKALAVSITKDQAKKLKDQPDNPQGRRDMLLMCLLLEHGLRCGELAGLTVDCFDLKAGELRFYRPKVDKVQTHKLTRASLEAARAYFSSGDAPAIGSIWRKSGKGKADLLGTGLSERAITKRVAFLGRKIGLVSLSAHDCRHYWATQAARNHTPLDRLQDAGGWSSLAMPGRYIEAAKIANEGVKLGDD